MTGQPHRSTRRAAHPITGHHDNRPANDRASARGSGRSAASRALRNAGKRVPVAPVDAERLRAGVGAEMRELRVARGWSARRLASRAVMAPSTVTRIERGEIHPRRITLAGLAYALDPDDAGRIREALTAAAGDLMRPDTDGGLRRRRRINAAVLAGRYPLPTRLARSIALHSRADELRRQAFAAMGRPGALDDPTALREATAALDAERAARKAAGPAVRIHAGGKVLRWVV